MSLSLGSFPSVWVLPFHWLSCGSFGGEACGWDGLDLTSQPLLGRVRWEVSYRRAWGLPLLGGGSAGAFAPLQPALIQPAPASQSSCMFPSLLASHGSVLAAVVERDKGPRLLIFTTHRAPVHKRDTEMQRT